MKTPKYYISICMLFLFFLGMAQNSGSTLFTLLESSQTNIDFNNQIRDEKEKNILLYSNFYGGAGVGVGDFNNDGLTDVFFAGNMVEDKLYLNKGNFVFEDFTKSSGIENDKSWSTGVTVADINNDGLLDIYITKELYDHQPQLRKNKLYINQGDAKFIEMAEIYGVADTERSRHATFLDYDNDGYLDLFVLNQPPNPGSYSEYFGTKLLQEKYTSKLYKNINGKSFQDVTVSAGLVKAGFPNGVSASDLNHDGFVDLYVANDFYAPDFLYMNNGDGTFTNKANSALKHMSYYSMGVDVADINNDGLLDVFVVDMVAEDNFRLKSNMSGMNPNAFWNVVKNGGHYQYMFNNLHLNKGNDTYSEIAQLTNMAATDWSWANLIADFDNDGNKDFYITNGLLRDIRNTDASKAVGDYVVEYANTWVKEHPNAGDVSIWDILDLDKTLAILPSDPLSNYMFKNNGNLQFEKVAQAWGLDQKSFSNGAAYADFDNDGDLDIIVNNINTKAFVYKNNASNNYLRLQLLSKENKPVFGTKIKIKTPEAEQFFETTNVRGIYSTSENIVHFGIGSAQEVLEVSIQWPNGTTTKLNNVKANQKLDIFLEDGKKVKSAKKKKDNTLISDITENKKIDFEHQENIFDDYKYQVLLPHKMSQFGPALAVSDVNNDGLEDVYIGASTGNSAKLFLQNKQGNFIDFKTPDFEKNKIHEDLDAIFFDIDSDGDEDLYVVSGGNEFEMESKNYNDRVYLNNGMGKFSKSNKSIENINTSGSVVIPADFDKDGDLDLFIGGRHQPRNYPTPANSKILVNENGKLVDKTNQLAKDLNHIGMVTDAIWTDFDNDEDLDLFIVGEWMPLTILKNEGGKFNKVALEGLEDSSGWWFSIEQGDFDKDGDMDFIAGNLGLNYKYKTSKEEPFDVFYEDFDGNGKGDIVLGYYNFGKHFPVRGFSCSSQQVPKLKKDIKKYDIFASMEMTEIYGKDKLSESLHYETQTFASSFIENLGNGKFKVSALPTEAQFSSTNDILIHDVNKDGNLDVIMVGNLYVSEIETTRNDAGIGVVLLGDGANNFKSISHKESGFFANGDAKKIKLLTKAKQKLILVGNNKDKLQMFRLNN